ncbi:hypothetical protein GJ496_010183 [Pomphorhynchus laevis]|nr:hypothetical protein GJ496_010183 [Pomphorhynchus laevis]
MIAYINPDWDDWIDFNKDVERSDTVSSRLALCNMDWDKITAKDLYMSLYSIIPKDCTIKDVKVYVSEYGAELMNKEKIYGPQFDKLGQLADDEELLRRYEIDRLKYYFAVATFDSRSTAEHVYDQAESLEFESSGIQMDLRFVPSDMEFEDNSVRDSCCKPLDACEYKPKYFQTKALSQSKVPCTWDDTNIDRVELISSACGSSIDPVNLEKYSLLVVNDDDAIMSLDESSNHVQTDKKDYNDDELLNEFRKKLSHQHGDDVFGRNRKDDSDDSFSMDVSWTDKATDDPSSYVSKSDKKAVNSSKSGIQEVSLSVNIFYNKVKKFL